MRTSTTMSIFMGNTGVEVEADGLEPPDTAWVHLSLGGDNDIVFYTDHLKKAEALAEALRNCRMDSTDG